MKKEHVLLILVFGTIWGVVEVVLGGVLFRADVPYASVPLAIAALVILTVARVYVPKAGTATLIALCAMLYKFLNVPFFGCHLSAILLLGVSYDVASSLLRIRNHSLRGITASYLGFALFALAAAYLFRYPHFLEQGLLGVARYAGVNGTFAALGSAFALPAAARLAEVHRAKARPRFVLRSKLAVGSSVAVLAGLWIMGAVVSF